MPSDEQVRAAVVKQTRRGIIDLLNMAWPTALRFDTICENFLDVDEHYVWRDLCYLVESAYVVGVDHGGPRAQRRFKLTASGVDIALAINKDPALTP